MNLALRPRTSVRIVAALAFAALCAASFIQARAEPAPSASIMRSADIDAAPDAVWAVIGPFCAIKDWHPAIATCTVDGLSPPTRTLVAKDGKTTFVEPEIARSDKERFYSYTFRSSPFPVSRYMATIHVVARGPAGSTVVWTGTYVPAPGREAEAEGDFAGVYEAGLAALKKRFEPQGRTAGGAA